MKNYDFFATNWIQSWNNHEIDSILSNLTDDVEFHSPLIQIINFNTIGIINSKQELKKYFEIGLSSYPNLKFTLLKVFSGSNSVAIYYESINNKEATEVFFLNNNGQAFKVYCHYL